jgi:hypothetical protein
MYFMATSSLVSLCRINRATPKLPAPMSLSTSYFSMDDAEGETGQPDDRSGPPLVGLGSAVKSKLLLRFGGKATEE